MYCLASWTGSSVRIRWIFMYIFFNWLMYFFSPSALQLHKYRKEKFELIIWTVREKKNQTILSSARVLPLFLCEIKKKNQNGLVDEQMSSICDHCNGIRIYKMYKNLISIICKLYYRFVFVHIECNVIFWQPKQLGMCQQKKTISQHLTV